MNKQQLQVLKELSEFNYELTESEFSKIINIYKNVIYRIKNKSNKYKCPHCGEYLIKDYEHTYEDGTKRCEYKCKNHYYTLETRE